MQSIDVSDLPEPLARIIAQMVEELRRQLVQATAQPPASKVPELSRCDGTVIGTLSREEIYDDV
jgi:hypothetical protein